MKKSTVALSLVFIIGFTAILLSETAEDKGHRYAKMSDDRPKFQKVKGDITLKIYSSSGKIRFIKKIIMAAYTENMGTANEVEKYISYFKEPADDKGNSYLALNFKNRSDIKQVYLKGIRKAKKVTGADARLSFFGSDFTNADVGKPDFYDWTYKFIGEEDVEFKGKKFSCYVVENIPKDERVRQDSGYSKKVSFLEKKTMMTLRTDYYDHNSQKQKELKLISFTAKNNIKGEKVYYESGLVMVNVQTGSKTELLFSNLQFEAEAKIRTDIFTEQYLTRKWW